MVTRNVEQLVDDARGEIERLSPEETFRSLRDGALLIDIRPQQQRHEHGVVPNALIIERNVLEWRLDPSSAFRIPEATGHDRHVLVLCQQGYASSLAAASLRALGYTRVGDVIGGFDAWQRAGLPVAPG
jgi:rhodanese-related sulfurtransferase